MSVLFIVVPLALLVALAAVLAYVWAARRGQLDDLVTPAWRMLNDDAGPTGRNSEPGREGATSTTAPDPIDRGVPGPPTRPARSG